VLGQTSKGDTHEEYLRKHGPKVGQGGGGEFTRKTPGGLVLKEAFWVERDIRGNF